MPARQDITPADMQNIRQRFGYSPGVRVGQLLYIAGTLVGIPNSRLLRARKRSLPKLLKMSKKVLTAAGASFDQVVEMVTYHTDMHDLALFIEVKNRYFRNPDRLPTWTAITTPALAMPGLFVEIKCTACLE
jgi:enamine deaminase RidA (YjgF/YER057c/UK114 family)